MRPDLVAGHSIGEVAAAHAAGVLSLADACTLVAARGRLMDALPGGAMAAVAAGEDEVAAHLAQARGAVEIAAVNGPAAVVVSGDEAAVRETVAYFRDRGRATAPLRVSHAFHSVHMEPMLAEFAEVVRGLSFTDPAIALVTAVAGRAASDEELRTPEFWVDHVRRPVRFADSLAHLRARGAAHFVEVGPDGVLTGLAGTCLTAPEPLPATAPAARTTPPPTPPATAGTPEAGAPAADAPAPLILPTLRGARPEAGALLDTVAALHAHGVPVDWRAVFTGRGARRTALPTYAFQRRRYWLDADPPQQPVPVPASGPAPAGPPHSFLRSRTVTADDDGLLLGGLLAPRDHPWLADHTVAGDVLLPGTAFVEMALYAGEQAGTPVVDELTLTAPLPLPPDGSVELQMKVAGADGAGRRALTVHARLHDAEAAPGPWRRHATATLVAAGDQPAQEPSVTPAADHPWPPPGAVPLDLDGPPEARPPGGAYARLARAGLHYGPAFRGLRAAWRLGDEVYAEVTLPEAAETPAPGEGTAGFALHPALFDAALHTVALAGLPPAQDQPPGEHQAPPEDAPDGGAAALPFSFAGVRLHSCGARRLRVRMTPAAAAGHGGTAVAQPGRAVSGAEGGIGLELADETGAPVATIRRLFLRPLPRTGSGAVRTPCRLALPGGLDAFAAAARGLSGADVGRAGRSRRRATGCPGAREPGHPGVHRPRGGGRRRTGGRRRPLPGAPGGRRRRGAGRAGAPDGAVGPRPGAGVARGAPAGRLTPRRRHHPRRRHRHRRHRRRYQHRPGGRVGTDPLGAAREPGPLRPDRPGRRPRFRGRAARAPVGRATRDGGTAGSGPRTGNRPRTQARGGRAASRTPARPGGHRPGHRCDRLAGHDGGPPPRHRVRRPPSAARLPTRLRRARDDRTVRRTGGLGRPGHGAGVRRRRPAGTRRPARRGTGGAPADRCGAHRGGFSTTASSPRSTMHGSTVCCGPRRTPPSPCTS
ncbi:hypothetical protein GCM10020254_81420 [Streptomyces goshikiensis]